MAAPAAHCRKPVPSLRVSELRDFLAASVSNLHVQKDTQKQVVEKTTQCNTIAQRLTAQQAVTGILSTGSHSLVPLCDRILAIGLVWEAVGFAPSPSMIFRALTSSLQQIRADLRTISDLLDRPERVFSTAVRLSITGLLVCWTIVDQILGLAFQ